MIHKRGQINEWVFLLIVSLLNWIAPYIQVSASPANPQVSGGFSTRRSSLSPYRNKRQFNRETLTTQASVKTSTNKWAISKSYPAAPCRKTHLHSVSQNSCMDCSLPNGTQTRSECSLKREFFSPVFQYSLAQRPPQSHLILQADCSIFLPSRNHLLR